MLLSCALWRGGTFSAEAAVTPWSRTGAVQVSENCDPPHGTGDLVPAHGHVCLGNTGCFHERQKTQSQGSASPRTVVSHVTQTHPRPRSPVPGPCSGRRARQTLAPPPVFTDGKTHDMIHARTSHGPRAVSTGDSDVFSWQNQWPSPRKWTWSPR